jgi:thymidylate synthase (FAD)
MKVDLLDCTTNPEDLISKCAGVCYGKDGHSKQRLNNLMEKGHFSALRVANATFLISGVSRVCSHQLVRTGHAGFLQRSQRYVKELADQEVIVPPSITELMDNPTVAWSVREVILAAKQTYATLLDNGIKKEDARFFLLQGTQTKLTMTGNFQMWYEFIKKRTAPQAQWEIRNVANAIKGLLHEQAPNIF